MIAEFKRGLESAAIYLEGTAADYMQMAKHVVIPDPGQVLQMMRNSKIREKQALIDKADLLKGQAALIRGLK